MLPGGPQDYHSALQSTAQESCACTKQRKGLAGSSKTRAGFAPAGLRAQPAGNESSRLIGAFKPGVRPARMAFVRPWPSLRALLISLSIFIGLVDGCPLPPVKRVPAGFF